MKHLALLLFATLAGCGSVSANAHDASGNDTAANTGGASGGTTSPRPDGSAGTGGAAGAPGGAGGSMLDAAACLGLNPPGFAYNGTCDGGAPIDDGCHAMCELNGAHFVGCTTGPLAYTCYPTCAACP